MATASGAPGLVSHDPVADTWRECPQCGLISALPPIQADRVAVCPRCRHALWQMSRHPFEIPLACGVSALLFYCFALIAPFLEISAYGRYQLANISTGPAELMGEGFQMVGWLVLGTTVIFPGCKLAILLIVLLGLKTRLLPASLLKELFRWYGPITPWAMIDVYLLGFLVAFTRITALASVHLDTALYSLIGVMLAMAAADATLDPETVWRALDVAGHKAAPVSAGEDLPPIQTSSTGVPLGFIGCHCCDLVNRAEPGEHCRRCGVVLHKRKHDSINRSGALLLAAAMLYVPANIYPIMTMTEIAVAHPYTIMGGIVDLYEAGLWPLAALVFFASFTVPLMKIIMLGYLLAQTQTGSTKHLPGRTTIYRIIAFVGRWSMIDVFGLSILVALVQFAQFANFTAEIGATCFAAVVVLTMFAVDCFDPRLMWDAQAPGPNANFQCRHGRCGKGPGMTDTPTTSEENGNPPQAQTRRPRFSVVWIIPIIAAVLAAYLGYRTVAERGPLLTLTFDDGSGLTSEQTQLQYKSVTLGIVERVDLSNDNKHVIVRVRMNNVGTRFLTDHARFWIVRPSFGGGNLSGLQTLVSGDYITVDPGSPGGHYRNNFIGLEEPPGVRSDDPGHTYVLKAANIGSLGTGSPVFYRDIPVGEVLGYDIGNGLGPVTVSIFVRSPYDQLVRPQSHFWNSSGITAGIQGGAFHIEFQSLQALLSGGVTFDLPPQAVTSAPSPDNAIFPLYEFYNAANAAGYLRKITVVTYFSSSVNGLVAGAPVDVLGIQIGQVTDVKLVLDLNTAIPKVRVALELQPERVFQTAILPKDMSLEQAMQKLVDKGLRAEVATANYVTGQQIISLVTVVGAAPVQVTTEGDAFVFPSQGSAFASIASSLSVISDNLAKVKFDELSDNLNKLLVTTNRTVADSHIQQTLATLSQTLNSLNRSYGNDSDFEHNLEQLMTQANDTLQSLDQLSSYLDRHPEALLRGRSDQ